MGTLACTAAAACSLKGITLHSQVSCQLGLRMYMFACVLLCSCAVIKSLEACQDFHPSCLKAVCRAASSCCSEMLAKEASALALRMLLVKPEGTSCLPAGQEAGVVLHHMCAVLKCIDAAPTSGPGLFNELVQATKLATRRMKLLGAERFAGGPRGGAAAITLRAITDVAAGGVSRALRQGALEQTVMLATALCVLLHLTNKGGGQPGRLQQGRMIMLAVQALLNLHESATSGTDRSALGRCLAWPRHWGAGCSAVYGAAPQQPACTLEHGTCCAGHTSWTWLPSSPRRCPSTWGPLTLTRLQSPGRCTTCSA